MALLALLMTVSGSAQGTRMGGNTLDGEVMARTLKILDNVEGYVFIESGEDKARDLSETFSRANDDIEADDLRALDWDVYSPYLVTINNEGKIFGTGFGQTIVTMKESDGTIHSFLVFVCPSVTVCSPDGVIYTHQAITGEKIKTRFTQSERYAISSVMAKRSYDNAADEIYDITDQVSPDGSYESADPIWSNIVYTVTMEYDEDDNLLSMSPVRVMVMDGVVEFAARDPQETDAVMAFLKGATVKVTDLNNQDIVQETSSAINFESDDKPKLNTNLDNGVYYLKLTNGEESYSYKIIINK